MKAKLKTKKALGAISFTIEGSKGDQVDYVDAERLQRDDLVSFLPFTYGTKGKTCRIEYRVGGLICLSELLKTPLPPLGLCLCLQSFLQLMRDCEENNLMRQRVAVELDKVFFDSAKRQLRFVYAPLHSFASSATGLNGALVSLCEQALVPASELWLRDAALDYSRRTPIITGIEFGAFLKSLGILPGCNTASPHMSSEATDGSYLRLTDSLDDRTRHGFDFVSNQVQARACEEGRDPLSSELRDWGLVRLSNGACWTLGFAELLIGRESSCGVCLQDVQGLSRKHAAIGVTRGGCTVRDLNSTNGVLVNGCRIAPSQTVLLRLGDRLTLGSEDFEIH